MRCMLLNESFLKTKVNAFHKVKAPSETNTILPDETRSKFKQVFFIESLNYIMFLFS